MDKISAVYKIVNTVTGDFYIGSSKDVKRRWSQHRRPSQWKYQPNNKLYQDMQKYGVDKFSFEILEEVETQYLKQAEQKFIDILNPMYNQMYAKGWDFERRKDYKEKYNQSENGKVAKKKYNQSENGKVAKKKYNQSNKGKQAHKKYNNQLCIYNGETLTLCALRTRFRRAGISNPTVEAKKCLINATN